jgi:CBS domain-containing protein
LEIKPLITEDFVILDEESTLSELIGKLKTFEKRTALVFRKKKYLGLIEKKKLLKSRLDVSKAKIKNFVQKTPIISENADLIETAYLMYQSDLRFVPVESDKKIVGVLNALDLTKLIAELPEVKNTKVKDIKLVKPRKVNMNDPLSTAMNIMFQEKVDHIPLFEQGEVAGIITFKDILRKYLNWSPKRNFSAKFNAAANAKCAASEMPKLDNLPVSGFSTNYNLVTIISGEPLTKAINLMLKKGISDLLVMENNEFVGMLTVKNILRKIGSLKIPKKFTIKFVGLNKTKLEPYQKYSIKKIASNEAMKLQRKIKNELNITLHLKVYDKGGRQKFSVHIKLEYPGQLIASNQDDWDLETALRKTFENAKNAVKKKFRGDSSRDKEYE